MTSPIRGRILAGAVALAVVGGAGAQVTTSTASDMSS